MTQKCRCMRLQARLEALSLRRLGDCRAHVTIKPMVIHVKQSPSIFTESFGGKLDNDALTQISVPLFSIPQLPLARSPPMKR